MLCVCFNVCVFNLFCLVFLFWVVGCELGYLFFRWARRKLCGVEVFGVCFWMFCLWFLFWSVFLCLGFCVWDFWCVWCVLCFCWWWWGMWVWVCVWVFEWWWCIWDDWCLFLFWWFFDMWSCWVGCWWLWLFDVCGLECGCGWKEVVCVCEWWGSWWWVWVGEARSAVEGARMIAFVVVVVEFDFVWMVWKCMEVGVVFKVWCLIVCVMVVRVLIEVVKFSCIFSLGCRASDWDGSKSWCWCFVCILLCFVLLSGEFWVCWCNFLVIFLLFWRVGRDNIRRWGRWFFRSVFFWLLFIVWIGLILLDLIIYWWVYWFVLWFFELLLIFCEDLLLWWDCRKFRTVFDSVYCVCVCVCVW